MKKLTAFVLALACVWGLIGCSNQPAQAQSIKLLKEGNITDIGPPFLKVMHIPLAERTQKLSLIICLT